MDLNFEWNPLRKGAYIALSDDNKTMVNTGSKGWQPVISRNVLSADATSSVLWETTLIDDGQSGIQIGFVDISAVDDVKMSAYCRDVFVLEIRMIIRTDDFCKRYQGKHIKFASKWKASICKKGDRVLLSFDFAEGICTVFYNDEKVGILSDSLPNQLHLVVSIYPRDVKLSCTKLEASTKI